MSHPSAKKPILTGIFGHPLAHSLSPDMHNAAFTALGLNGDYRLLDVPPAGLAEAVNNLRVAGFSGASVTVPHKQGVMPLLDEITTEAQAIGAVNTIVRQNDRLIGDNTDWQGFLAPLREQRFDLAGRHCVVVGAGGAARAVVYALGRAGTASVTLFNRTASRAEALAHDMQPRFPKTVLRAQPMLAAALAHEPPALLVNATSVGMWPNVDACPWPDDLPLPAGATVYDLVYNPLQTKLLRQAEEAGCRTIDGVGMLVHQGAIAFEMWTGRKAPLNVMFDTVRSLL